MVGADRGESASGEDRGAKPCGAVREEGTRRGEGSAKGLKSIGDS